MTTEQTATRTALDAAIIATRAAYYEFIIRDARDAYIVARNACDAARAAHIAALAA